MDTIRIDEAIERVLNQNPVLIKHPGNTLLNQFYPNSESSTTHVAEAINYNGQIRVNTNNLRLGATSNFTLSSSLLVYGLAIRASITVPANHKVVNGGWLFDLIDNIQFTVSNSTLNNIVLRGNLMKEYLLNVCENADERTELLGMAGDPLGASESGTAVIPIGWIFGTGSGMDKDWPIDMSTLNGSIQIQIAFNSSNLILGRSGAAVTSDAIASFNSLELITSHSSLIDGAFGVKAMLMSTNLTYVLPGKYLSGVRYTQSITLGNETSVNLNSAPSGMLESIILSITPVAKYAAQADGVYPYSGTPRLSTLRLQFNGVDLYRAVSNKEIMNFNRVRFNSDLKQYNYPTLRAANNTNLAADRSMVTAETTIIPLSYNTDSTLSKTHVDNLPSYSGSTLQLFFTIPTASGTDGSFGLTAPATPFFPAGVSQPGAATQDYYIDVLYVISSLGEINRSTIDLIM